MNVYQNSNIMEQIKKPIDQTLVELVKSKNYEKIEEFLKNGGSPYGVIDSHDGFGILNMSMMNVLSNEQEVDIKIFELLIQHYDKKFHDYGQNQDNVFYYMRTVGQCNLVIFTIMKKYGYKIRGVTVNSLFHIIKTYPDFYDELISMIDFDNLYSQDELIKPGETKEEYEKWYLIMILRDLKEKQLQLEKEIAYAEKKNIDFTGFKKDLEIYNKLYNCFIGQFGLSTT